MKQRGTVELRTRRLVLRRFAAGDANAVYEAYGEDGDNARYTGFAPCATPEHTRAFLAENERHYAEDPSWYSWAITLKGQIIGSIAAYDVDERNCSAEVGYTVGRAWTGSGYARESLAAVIDFLLEDVGLNRVSGWCDTRNVASAHVMVSCGMSFEGIAREAQAMPDGLLHDVAYFSILKADRRPRLHLV